MDRGGSRRRSLRRAVTLPCALQSNYWDGSVSLSMSDLSEEGLWIDTSLALEPGEEIVLAFQPPGRRTAELWALAEVARVGMWRRADDVWPAGMGLLFTYVSNLDRRMLSHALQGRPPRLPARRPPPLRRRPPPLPTKPPPLPRALEPEDFAELDAYLALPPVLAVSTVRGE